MLKNRLIMVVLVAIASVFIMSHTQAINVSQIDALKHQFLPAEYRNTNFSLEDLKRVFKAKCRKATGIDNSTFYQEVEKQAFIFTKCISGMANLTALQQEIEEARPMGNLDTVFHKHCLTVPEAEQCFKDFNNAIQPCLTKKEKAQNAVMMRIFTGLLGFMCARGGDQVALFVAEEGPECFEANKDAISHCANKSFSDFMPKNKNVADIFNMPDFVLEPEHCIDLVAFEKCTVHHLEDCEEVTAANVAESVFRFIKNETNCKSWLENKANAKSILKKKTSSSASSSPGHFIILVAVLSTFLVSALKTFNLRF